jgi:hypothetical protein
MFGALGGQLGKLIELHRSQCSESTEAQKDVQSIWDLILLFCVFYSLLVFMPLSGTESRYVRTLGLGSIFVGSFHCLLREKEEGCGRLVRRMSFFTLIKISVQHFESEFRSCSSSLGNL